MSRFAHMSDIHLGAHREPVLRDLEQQCFSSAVDRCLEERVDFIVVSGDLFHVGIPDLTVVNLALRRMKELRDAGIPIYAIYGSHDYTPTGTSVIDILDTAGILKKLMHQRIEEGRLKLKMVVDPRTGAKLTGISARKIGLESKYYDVLDRESLEREAGFKVFAFHSGIAQFRPEFLSLMEAIDIARLPKGFDYYAGGHVHQRGEFHAPGYSRVVFPGPLFTGYGGRDIETTARGERRGFYVVEFRDDRFESMRFCPVHGFDGEYVEFDATGLNSSQANADLGRRLAGLEVHGKVVVLRVQGELAGGKTSDIDFHTLRRALIERGALWIYINRYGLTSGEFTSSRYPGEDPAAVEAKLFAENLERLKLTTTELTGERGAARGSDLLRTLRQGQKSNELKKDYTARMVSEGLEALGVKSLVEEPGENRKVDRRSV